MRIDRYLHCIRLIKSRTLAQALIDQGHVRIDGKRVLKSAEEVREGQVIALPLRGAIRILRITAPFAAYRRQSQDSPQHIALKLRTGSGRLNELSELQQRLIVRSTDHLQHRPQHGFPFCRRHQHGDR